MPSDCEYTRAGNLIRAVFNKLNAKIVREYGSAYLVAEVQPDVFIQGDYSIYGRHRNKIHWVAIYNNVPDSDTSCYTSADRATDALANDVRNRVLPQAVVSCKEARARYIREQKKKLTGDIRLAQLEAIMGPIENRSGSLISGPYTLMLSKYDLEGDRFCARVSMTVRDWHCFLMIARLLKESERLG